MDKEEALIALRDYRERFLYDIPLSFGKENIKFRTYSQIVTDEILYRIEMSNDRPSKVICDLQNRLIDAYLRDEDDMLYTPMTGFTAVAGYVLDVLRGVIS